MHGFSGKWARTYGRTNVRMNGGESKGPSTDGGETKNQTIPMHESEDKWEKPHF